LAWQGCKTHLARNHCEKGLLRQAFELMQLLSTSPIEIDISTAQKLIIDLTAAGLPERDE